MVSGFLGNALIQWPFSWLRPTAYILLQGTADPHISVLPEDHQVTAEVAAIDGKCLYFVRVDVTLHLPLLFSRHHCASAIY